jgi:hypothetical protein
MYAMHQHASCCRYTHHTRQVREIMSKLSDRRQTLLFSATLPTSLAEFAKAGLSAPQVSAGDTWEWHTTWHTSLDLRWSSELVLKPG